jgi:hypothetical protein
MMLWFELSRKAVCAHSRTARKNMVAMSSAVTERPPRDDNARFSARSDGEDLG